MGLRSSDAGENETRAIAQRHAKSRELQGLNVLGLSGRSAHAHPHRANQRIDHRTFADVREAHEADGASPSRCAGRRRVGSASADVRQSGEQLVEECRGVHDAIELVVSLRAQGLLIVLLLRRNRRLLALAATLLWRLLRCLLTQQIVVAVAVRNRHMHRAHGLGRHRRGCGSGVAVLVLLPARGRRPREDRGRGRGLRGGPPSGGRCLLGRRGLLVLRRPLLGDDVRSGLRHCLTLLPPQLVQRRKVHVIDTFRLEVLGPSRPLGIRQEVGLVAQQHEALLSAADFLHIACQVPAVVEVRVSGIHNLHQEVASLHAAPELPPEVQIPLVRRQVKAFLLGLLGERAAPAHEALRLDPRQLVHIHAVLPERPPRNRHVFSPALGLRLRRQHLVGPPVGDQGRPLDELGLAGLVCPSLLPELDGGYQVVEVRLLEYRFPAGQADVHLG
mmetsp:Transcript_86592/g.279561  ORF Transcript_86592/g.279561 Transcript_86592/m.279561 type:complete len:446 (+) Transcript_86592:756-2093(+)